MIGKLIPTTPLPALALIRPPPPLSRPPLFVFSTLLFLPLTLLIFILFFLYAQSAFRCLCSLQSPRIWNYTAASCANVVDSMLDPGSVAVVASPVNVVALAHFDVCGWSRYGLVGYCGSLRSVALVYAVAEF